MVFTQIYDFSVLFNNEKLHQLFAASYDAIILFFIHLANTFCFTFFNHPLNADVVNYKKKIKLKKIIIYCSQNLPCSQPWRIQNFPEGVTNPNSGRAKFFPKTIKMRKKKWIEKGYADPLLQTPPLNSPMLPSCSPRKLICTLLPKKIDVHLVPQEN